MPDDSGSHEKTDDQESFSAFGLGEQIKDGLFAEISPMLPQGEEIRVLLERITSPWPDWTLIAIGKYAGAFFPTLKPKQITLGILALINGNFDKFDNLTHSQLIGHIAAISNFLEINQRLYKGPIGDKIFDSNKKIILDHLAFILFLPKAESEACLAAFSKAYSNTFTEDGQPKGVKTNQPILWALIFRWPIIEKLPSVSALHEYLHTVLSSHLVGDIKRLEAICKEHKIKFRDRGRPKKS